MREHSTVLIAALLNVLCGTKLTNVFGGKTPRTRKRKLQNAYLRTQDGAVRFEGELNIMPANQTSGFDFAPIIIAMTIEQCRKEQHRNKW